MPDSPEDICTACGLSLADHGVQLERTSVITAGGDYIVTIQHANNRAVERFANRDQAFNRALVLCRRFGVRVFIPNGTLRSNFNDETGSSRLSTGVNPVVDIIQQELDRRRRNALATERRRAQMGSDVAAMGVDMPAHDAWRSQQLQSPPPAAPQTASMLFGMRICVSTSMPADTFALLDRDGLVLSQTEITMPAEQTELLSVNAFRNAIDQLRIHREVHPAQLLVSPHLELEIQRVYARDQREPYRYDRPPAGLRITNSPGSDDPLEDR